MYIKQLKINNYGPISEINYSLPFTKDESPIPVILIGKNGTGKTLVLSNILHSLIQIKRNFYTELQEVSSNKYYRSGSKHYIQCGKNDAFEKITFNNDSYYVDLMVNDYKIFKEQYDPTVYTDINITDENLIESGFFNTTKKPNENVFEKEVFLYFPVERYYIPTWENPTNRNLKFVTDDLNYLGHSDDNIIKYNLLDDIESWILDVIIDKMLYEITDAKNSSTVPHYKGKNNTIQNHINFILSKIFSNRNYTSVRIGISDKVDRKIVVIGINADGTEEKVIPKFSNFSSGEMMIFGIFASIIKEYDRVSEFDSMGKENDSVSCNTDTIINFDSVTGIVLIDEIDTHLHSDLLKDVLPMLIKLFPKIQFIITSHSPFFLIGMQETFGSKCQFLTLPTGTIMESISNFNEIKRCYSIIDENYNNILKTIDDYNKRDKDENCPLIVTEGQTDWKHLKHAINALQSQGIFSELHVKFHEYEDELGESKLENLLINLAKIPRKNKVIGVFDSDTKIGSSYSTIKNFGNNVYACCIKDVHEYGCGISIELLYTRDDLIKCDTRGRRLYLSDEFTEKSSVLKTDSSIVCQNKSIIEARKKGVIKIIDNGIYDTNENSLALSKEMFAQNVLSDIEPFSTLSVDGFKNIFETIQSILIK